MRRSLPRFLFSVGLLAGCGASAAPTDASAAGDGSAARDTGCALPDPIACVDTTPDPGCTATWLAALEGRLVDDSGAPIEGGRAQLCARLAPDDRLVCLDPPRTLPDGSFTVVVAPSVRCMRSATMRYVVPGGGLATTYCDLDLAIVADGVARLDEDAVVFRVDPAVGLPALGDESVAREVDLGPVVLDLAPSSLGLGAPYEELGARAVAPSRSCLASLRAMEATIALAPEARLAPRAPLRVRLEGALPGDRIEVHLVGGLATERLDGSLLDEGELALLGTGTVGADGLVTFPSDVGLTYLSWLGLRHAPTP